MSQVAVEKKAKAKKKLKNASVINSEKPVSDFVPYTRHVTDTLIETDNGEILATIRLEGIAHQTATDEYLAQLKNGLNTTLLSIASSNYALVTHIVRRREKSYPDGEFNSDFENQLNDRYREKMGQKRLLKNVLYLTVIRKGASGKINAFGDMVKSLFQNIDIEAQRRAKKKQREEFTEVVNQLMTDLEAYTPEILKVRRLGGLLVSEPLSFYSFLLNGVETDVLVTRQSAKSVLPIFRPYFTNTAFEISTFDSKKVGASLTIKNYPPETNHDMLDGLLTLPYELIVTQTFYFHDRDITLDRLKTQERQMSQSDDDAITLREQLVDAIDQVASESLAFGSHTMTVMVIDNNLQSVKEGLSAVNGELKKKSMIPIKNDITLEGDYWAQLPGNTGYLSRRADISSKNFAGLSSFHNYPVGQKTNNHWGDALMMIETVAGSPYFFNLHVADVGNTLITGPTGSGKTVTQNMILAMAGKFGTRRVFFDKDRGAEIFIRAVGGSYAQVVPGEKTGFNPFHLPDNKNNRSFLRSLVQFMCSGGNPDKLDAEQMQRCSDFVDRAYTLPREHRRCAALAPLLPQGKSKELAINFSRWHSGGDLAWIFDNEVDNADFSADTFGYDLTHLYDLEIERTACMRYMFHRTNQLFDGRPIICNLDEAWKGLRDEYVGKRVEDWERVIRKLNGCINIGTQRAEDLAKTESGKVCMEQSPTKILYPNPDADREVYRELMHLTEAEYQFIINTSPKSRKFLVKIKQNPDEAETGDGKKDVRYSSVICTLDLKGMEDQINILSGRQATVELLDEIRADVGDDPQVWLPIFQQRCKEL